MGELITITEKARKKYQAALDKHKVPPNAALRVKAGEVTWSGKPELLVTLDEAPDPNDKVIRIAGVTIAYNPELEQYVENGTLDHNFPLKFFISHEE